jgi:hypothetical protein
MSNETETVATETAPKTTRKAPVKKAIERKGIAKDVQAAHAKIEQRKAKKAPVKKAAAAKAAEVVKQYGVDRDHDLPWNEKKVAVFKALKALKALGAAGAVSAQVVAEKANVSARDVRHYCYHAKAAGLVDVVTMEDVRGYAFCLTKEGAKVDLAKV